MDILIKASPDEYMPAQFYKQVNFEAGGLNQSDWTALADECHPLRHEKWKELFQEFEHMGHDGSYFLCLDREGNLCLAKEREIELMETEKI